MTSLAQLCWVGCRSSTPSAANQVGYALLDSAELGVELVPAGVVVSDQVAGVAPQHTQARHVGLGTGPHRGVGDQPCIGVRTVTACGAPGRGWPCSSVLLLITLVG